MPNAALQQLFQEKITIENPGIWDAFSDYFWQCLGDLINFGLLLTILEFGLCLTILESISGDVGFGI